MVEQGQTIRDLKQFLAERIGYSRFRQRLFGVMGELRDDMQVRPPPRVQLVILDFCAPDEAVEEELLRTCGENDVGKLEQLLQKPQDPRNRTKHQCIQLLFRILGSCVGAA